MIAEEQDDGICPCDSASNVPSRASQKSSRSSLAKAAAKKAALLAKQQHLGKLRALEEQKLQLEQQKLQQQLQASASERRLELDSKELNLQIDIDAQSAEERVYQQQLKYEQLTGFPTPNPHSVRDPLSLPESHVLQPFTKPPIDQHVTIRRKTISKDNIGPLSFDNDYAPSSSANPVASSAPSAHRGVTFKEPHINVTKAVTAAAQPPATQLLPPVMPAAVTTSAPSTTQVPQIAQSASAPNASTQPVTSISCTCTITAAYATPTGCSATKH